MKATGIAKFVNTRQKQLTLHLSKPALFQNNPKLLRILTVLIIFTLGTVSLTAVKANDWPKDGYDDTNTGHSLEELIGFNPWNKTITSQAGTCDIAIADGVLYVGCECLYALNASSGTQIWNFTIDSQQGIGPAVVKSGIVYANSWNHLYAINATTGQQLWVYETGSCNYIPNVADGIVYFGSLDYNIYALNATNGQKIWQFTAGSYFWAVCPAVANGLVYIASTDRNVYALDAYTGDLVWRYTALQGVLMIDPAIANGIVYFGADDRYFYALDAFSGRVIWKFFSSEQPMTSVVADGVVCFGSGLGVWGLNASTGDSIWRYSTVQGVSTSPAYVDGAVYFGDLSGSFFALDITTGEKLWETTFTNCTLSSSIAGHSLFMMVQGTGTVYSFRTVYAVTVHSDDEAAFTSKRHFVNYTGSVNASFTPKSGYKITHVYIDGQDMGPIASYNFVNVQAPSNVSVTTESLFPVTPSPAPTQTTTPTTAQTPKPTSTIIPSTEPTATALSETASKTPTATPPTRQTSDLFIVILASVAVLAALLCSLFIYLKKR